MGDSRIHTFLDTTTVGGRHQLRRQTWLLVLLFHISLVLIAKGGCHPALDNEVFSEDLLLRPLSDGKVLSHFFFKNSLRHLGSASHHHVFPKAVSQLVRKFHIREMELSFTQGRWNYERWGALDPIASSNVKPLGVELWAAFDVPLDQVDSTWRNLTNALSGLFCASLNFLEAPAMMAAPEFAFGPGMDTAGSKGGLQFTTKGKGDSGFVRYGALPRESVCTENLTPWLKLLPCRDKAGISTLLNRPSIYKGYYHSLRVHLLSGHSGAEVAGSGTLLEQTLTLVLQPSSRERSGKDLPHWSLSSVFGRRLEGSCPLAKTSHVMLELEGSLVEKAESLHGRKGQAGQDAQEQSRNDEIDLFENDVLDVTPDPDANFRESMNVKLHGDDWHPSVLLDYNLQKYTDMESLDLEVVWKQHVSWRSHLGPFRVSRFLVGSGNEKGSIAVELKSNSDQNVHEIQDWTGDNFKRPSANSHSISNPVVVTVFQLVPWYVRLYTHTLTAFVDGFQTPLRDIVTRMRIVPAEDRLAPAVLEMQLQLPANISMLYLNVEFDKGYLHIDEHPPDANRGFDLPSALVTFPKAEARTNYVTLQSDGPDTGIPLLQTLQSGGPVHIYSESLLVPLATPDFSMPYNVITFTCTVLALYFGSLLNTLRRRIGEEERRQAKSADLQQKGLLTRLISWYMEGKSEKQKKVAKLSVIVIVVAIAVGANYVLGSG